MVHGKPRRQTEITGEERSGVNWLLLSASNLMNHMVQHPDFNVAGQVVLVTGAARGLGRETALAFARAGADVALGLREKDAPDLVDEIEGLGRRALPLQMDVTNLAQIAAAVDETVARFGRIDVLVNNAGIAPENLAEHVTESDFDATCLVNLKGTFFVSQAVGRVMIRQRQGRIVNLSSQAAFDLLLAKFRT